MMRKNIIRMLGDKNIDSIIVMKGWLKSLGVKIEIINMVRLCKRPMYEYRDMDVFKGTFELIPVDVDFSITASYSTYGQDITQSMSF